MWCKSFCLSWSFYKRCGGKKTESLNFKNMIHICLLWSSLCNGTVPRGYRNGRRSRSSSPVRSCPRDWGTWTSCPAPCCSGGWRRAACAAGTEASTRAGWKAPVWATGRAAPTGMEWCGLAVAASAAAGEGREKDEETLDPTSCRLTPFRARNKTRMWKPIGCCGLRWRTVIGSDSSSTSP